MTNSNDQTFYVTTPISYPNGSPHIGHAYEFVLADALARYRRLDGFTVFHLTGTDEHGLKMQQAADAFGMDPRELANEKSSEFRNLQLSLNIDYDRFIRTTESAHAVTAQSLWKRMSENGDIYRSKYRGWYSVRDEAYYTDTETSFGSDGERYAKSTNTKLVWQEEDSYFLKLSKYQKPLLEHFDRNPNFITPESAFNEVRKFVEQGLEDISISRTSFDWGIPVPGDDQHVMYVWIDALSNYLTAMDYPDTDSSLFQSFWPPNVQIVGKDILRFHGVYWPAMLLSAGVDLPEALISHGFINVDDQKMSKSLGNQIDPLEEIETYGVDNFRYVLLRDFPINADNTYSRDRIREVLNSELADNLGNLLNRTTSMSHKYLDSEVPYIGQLAEEDVELLQAAEGLLTSCKEWYAQLRFSNALVSILKLLHDANAYFSSQQPWHLRKENQARFETVIAVTIDVLKRVAILLQPIMPATSADLFRQLGVNFDNSNSEVPFDRYNELIAPGTRLPKSEILFRKILD